MEILPLESRESRRFRRMMNVWPMYRGTGGRIMLISADWKRLDVRLKRTFLSNNYVGTIFGGSMFSASDPFFMLMLMRILGKDCVVWDKAASIRFRRPAKETLFATFLINDAEVDTIRRQIAEKGETDYAFQLEWKDQHGVVFAQIERVVYAAEKAFYERKVAERKNKQK